MTDIVERLRKLADRERPYGSLPDVLDEAADLITRLRNELHIAQEWSARVIAGQGEDVKQITALRADNEKLRAALKDCIEVLDDLKWNTGAVERARAALEKEPEA